MKKFFKEFKDFALKGNVMNLAVGVIIGAAFQSIVTSLTTNILSPIIGLFAKQNFDDLKIQIWAAEIKYGAFITSVVNFVIMAFIVFLIVKGMNTLLTLGEKRKKNEPAAPPPPPTTKKCPYCRSEIAIEATRCAFCTSELDGQ